jgi:L-fucose isomerase-like protein
MINLPEVRIGIAAVSRNCFPVELSTRRRKEVAAACRRKGMEVEEISITVESEADAAAALKEIEEKKINCLVVYLGNFGPETPETLLAQKFDGPVMFAAAAEESGKDLFGGRGDAYCGLLNASYNIAMRKMRPYIPESPVGTADEIAGEMNVFLDIARVLLGLRSLKVFTFGPRPYDFIACNAPIQPLYDLGVEVMENSELDLLVSFNEHAGDSRIGEVVKEMEAELGKGNGHPGILAKLAQYELTLLDWYQGNRGICDYAVFANKCWPAFQTQFGFVPCYVNSRLTGRGIPVSCETDIYGALSEYIITCATKLPATLLDINNTVPRDMTDRGQAGSYKPGDLFMGFHCGNTPSCHLKAPALKHQLIMHRLLEPDKEPDITRGTLEGTINAGDITLFRLQGSADCRLTSYIAEGEVLDIDPKSFGGIGVVAIKEMQRFYRHVLVEKRYPHHAGVAFGHAGKVLFEAVKMLGAGDIAFNQPANMLYKSENPF